MLIVQEHKQIVEASTSGNCIRVVVDLNEMIDDDVAMTFASPSPSSEEGGRIRSIS
jgi:hypothetical protein